ncbi:hypothetical protein VTK73DRAFT_6051 [Phialemonium thermophilum]|uniref:Small ribosomal subunit protein mS41 n=1 Tax=Phialemonium thermophilum TaxID=223376 RepID=A0ABR3XW39_9PEZI
MRALRFPSALGLLLRPQITSSRIQAQSRWASTKDAQLPLVPPPRPFVPNVETFLTLIGRGLRQHAPKFPSWEALFSLTSEQLRELGIEPPRTRRYLLRWRQRFREGKLGIGGDLQHVENGTAQLRVQEIEKDPITRVRYVVNVPPGKDVEDFQLGELPRVTGYSVKGARTIVGPFALPTKEGGAQVTVTEGMWEDKRGHKIDGGERRRAEVRFKKRIAERRAMK